MATIEERLKRMLEVPPARKRGQVSKEELALALQFQKQFVPTFPSYNVEMISDCSESLDKMRSDMREARELREMRWEDHYTAKLTDAASQSARAKAKKLAQETAMLSQLRTERDKWLMAIELRLSTYLAASLSTVDSAARASFFSTINASNGQTPLHRACKTNDTELVKLLLALGAPLTAKDEAGKSVFHLLAELNQPELFTVLLDHLTVDNDDVLLHLDRAGHSLLHLAALRGSAAVLDLLLNGPHASRLQAVVNAQATRAQETALHLAARGGHSGCVRILLQSPHARSSLRNAKGSNALHLALLQSFNVDALVGEFTALGTAGDSDETFQSLDEATGRNCLHTAIIRGFRAVALALVREKRVQLNTATRDGGWSPLHLAVMVEEVPVVEALLAAGSMLDMVDSDGQTPLLQACLGGKLELVRLLLHAGANPAHQNKQAHSALHYLAAFCRDRQLLVDLVERGADVNAKSLKLNTPLHFAAMNGNDVAAHVLLAHGASASAINEDKRSVVYLAKKWRHRPVEDLVKPPEETADGPPGSAMDGARGKRPLSSGHAARAFVAQQIQGRTHARPATPLTSRSDDSDADSHYRFEDEEIDAPSTPWPEEVGGAERPSNNATGPALARPQSFAQLRDKFMALALTPQRTTLRPVPLSHETKLRLDTLVASPPALPELPRMQMTRFTRKFLAGPVRIPWDMTVPVPGGRSDSSALAAEAASLPAAAAAGVTTSLQRKLKPSIRTDIGLFRDHLAHAQELSWPQHAHHKAFRTSSLKYQAPSR
ncbi:hypothetical protein PybrP1_001352 [[Pythium] brassicae (nom. inval.)]|nr:hypothetical protein PybrP1_001352 [[Pythium] brassicae (nom. inval.)]